VIFALLIFSIVAFDQATKYFALRSLSEFESIPLIPSVLHLTLVKNQGVAFGLFRDHPSLLLALITLSLVVLLLVTLHFYRIKNRARFVLTFILAGAIGNWIDRLRFSSVIDFIDFRIWPVFNVADSFITIGAVLYLILLLKKEKTTDKKL